MVICKSEISRKVQAELFKNARIANIVAFAVGSVGLLANIILSIFIESPYLNALLLFALPFGFGLVFLISINITIKKAEQNKAENEYVFDDEFFAVTSSRNGDVVGTSKTYYKDIYKAKESKTFVLIYLNRQQVFPIKKANLTDEQLAEIKSLLKI